MRQSTQKTGRAGKPQGKYDVQQQADKNGNGGGHASTGDTQCRCPQIAENQHPVKQDIDRVHADDGVEIQPRQVCGTPVTAKGEVHAHRGECQQPHLQIRRALCHHFGIVIKESENVTGPEHQHQTQRNTNQHGQQQAAIQRQGSLLIQIFTEATR